MIVINNKAYARAKKNGFTGSFAQFAEEMNKVNSEKLKAEGLMDSRKYFNDMGGKSTWYIPFGRPLVLPPVPVVLNDIGGAQASGISWIWIALCYTVY